jgi:hypothetical protein
MRCAEVIRELAVPSDERDATALAEHLSSCQTCAAWALHATRLEELWEATKPHEPGTATWDAMWAKIAGSLDADPALHDMNVAALSPALDNLAFTGRFDPGPPDKSQKTRVRGRSLVAIALIGLAQAAAIFVAVTLGWHQPRSAPNPMPFNEASNISVSVEIEEGRTVLIRNQGSGCVVLDLTPDELVHGIDDFYVMFNAVESMANNSIVAMKE